MEYNLKNRIVFLMDTYGTTQKFLADKSETSKTTINLWLNGCRDLPKHSAIKLNRWLNSLNL